MRENIAGKRLVVVDDSIVRGTTQKQLVRMLREAGAAQVHLRITSPPYKWPCFYGMDTGDRGELLAAGLTVDEIRDYVDADSLAYLDLDRLVNATGATGAGFCTACLTGDYPVDVPVTLHKDVLEPVATHRGRPRRRPDRQPQTPPDREPTDDGDAMGETYEAAGVRHRRRRGGGRAHPPPRAARRSGPRSSATSAASAGCSPFPGTASTARCWCRPPTASGPRRSSPRPPAGSPRSASTWSPCAPTTSCARAPSRCSSSTTSPSGRLDPGHIDKLVEGVAEGCRTAGCALIGGEMAEHPGAMEPGEFDLVGFCVGVVERDQILTGDKVRPGDVLIGLPSPGLRSNGYSLARRVLLDRAGRPLDEPAFDGAHHSLADELLEPSVIYAPAVLAVLRAVDVHAVAHITGGGIPGNLRRVLPRQLDAVRRPAHVGDAPGSSARSSGLGEVADDEMRKVFNLGIGMVLVVAPDDVFRTLDTVRSYGHAASEIGVIDSGHGHVRFTAG